jgi:hypothetical protein
LLPTSASLQLIADMSIEFSKERSLFSRKPLANGLLSIFNCVIFYINKKKKKGKLIFFYNNLCKNATTKKKKIKEKSYVGVLIGGHSYELCFHECKRSHV